MKKILLFTTLCCFIGSSLFAQDRISHVSCTFKNKATILAGGGLKVRVDYKVVKIDNNGNKVAVAKDDGAKDGYTRYNEYNMTKEDTKSFDLNLNQGEYLDGPIHVQLREKLHASGKWSNSDEASLYPKDNELVIVCDGTICPGGVHAYIHRDSKLVYANASQDKTSRVSCTFKNNAFIIAGGGLKMRVDYKVVKIDNNGNKVAVAKEDGAKDGYTRYNEYQMGKGDNKTFDLKINEGEQLDGPIQVQLRQKTSATGKWSNSTIALVYPKDNELVIVSDGSIRPGGKQAYIHSDSKLIYAKDQN